MYDVAHADLSAIITEVTPKSLANPGKRVAEIAVLSMPLNASFRIRIGDSNPFFTVDSRFTMEPRGSDAGNGISFANPVAQVGVVIEVLLVYESGAEDRLNTLLA